MTEVQIAPGKTKMVDAYMAMPIKDWPDGLKAYVDYIQQRLGLCGEVLRYGVAVFCQEVAEDLHWEDDNFSRELRRRDAELDALRQQIAALPDLIAACVSLCSAADIVCAYNHAGIENGAPEFRTLTEAMREARAALRKAGVE